MVKEKSWWEWFGDKVWVVRGDERFFNCINSLPSVSPSHVDMKGNPMISGRRRFSDRYAGRTLTFTART
jgi:hypothetical protein